MNDSTDDFLISYTRLKSLLKKLFQVEESSDLDFGIYKIMRQKRDVIERFVETDLLKEAKDAFKTLASSSYQEKLKETDEARKIVVEAIGIDLPDTGDVPKGFEKFPVVNDYVRKFQDLKDFALAQVQVQDVFNLIYNFFSQYYENGDFISKRRFGGQNHYVIPYNGEETLLYWANFDQYYAKTSEYFKSYSFLTGNLRVVFCIRPSDVLPSNDEPFGGNRISTDRFFVLSSQKPFDLDNKDNTLIVWFENRTLSAEETKKYGRNIQSGLISEVVNSVEREHWDFEQRLLATDENQRSLLERHLAKYVARNASDFFIHKKLSSFLAREFDFFLKNEALNIDEMIEETTSNLALRLEKLKAVRRIVGKIIDFLSQIEDFQKAIFEKRKFVLRTEYCLTLDNVLEQFYEEISINERQVAEWKRLFSLDKISDGSLFRTKGKRTLDIDFLKSHKELVIDTRFFSREFKDRLISSFEDLDRRMQGLLIKAENFQALNLLLGKYREKIKCIYIDPPYNTGKDEFIYKDRYRHSSWLAMLYDRLALSRELLRPDGVIFVSVDDNEAHNLRNVMDQIFGEDNYLAQLVWDLGTGTTAGHFTRSHEYILAYANDKSRLPNFKYSGPADTIEHGALKKISRGNPASQITFPAGIEFEGTDAEFEGEISGSEVIRIINGKMVFREGKLAQPVTLEAGWAMRKQILSWLDRKETFDSKGQKVKRFFFGGNGRLKYEKERGVTNPPTVLRDIASTRKGSEELIDLFGYKPLSFPKPVELLDFLIGLTTDPGDIVLDFFAGSGTTAVAVLGLNQTNNNNRRYVLCEIADYFDTILRPRIEKRMYSKDWKDGVPLSNEGISHCFKYLYLEQYEESLENITLSTPDKQVQETLHQFGDYTLKYMLDYESRTSPVRLDLKQFSHPFEYNIILDTGQKISVDLVETFNYLISLEISKVHMYKLDDGSYCKAIFGENKSGKVVAIWRNVTPLSSENIDASRAWEESFRDFAVREILSREHFEKVYVNGDSLIPKAEPIEPEFMRLMNLQIPGNKS